MAVIPTKNPAALTAYYLGIASIIPFLGCVLALPALIFGIIGAIKANNDKAAGGMVHAVVGIVLGLIGPAIGIGLFMVLSSIASLLMGA